MLSLFFALPYSSWAADTTVPTTPVITDDGTYTSNSRGLHATWTSRDPESGISGYQYQIRQDSATGPIIVPWTSTGTTAAMTRTGLKLSQGKSYFVNVKARNGTSLWSAVGSSNGIAVDRTAPSIVTVTDDGTTTPSATTLHATWTAARDPESGIVAYEYCIQQKATIRNSQTRIEAFLAKTKTLVVGYTPVGLATEATRSNLSLAYGTTYFIGVRAKNAAGLYSATRYSDGIRISDTIPPTGTVVISGGAAATNVPSAVLAISATDDSGIVSLMKFSNDDATYSAPEPYATTKTWSLSSGEGAKTVYVRFSDPAGNWSSPVSASIALDMTPPTITVAFPQDGSLLGKP